MVNRVMTISLALALAVGAAAASPAPGEFPADEGFQGRPVRLDCPAQPAAGGIPIWRRLAGLTERERANAVISLTSGSGQARRIEDLWNSGAHDAALALLPGLAPQDICISWREPIPAPGTDWGNDVPVSARDSVREVQLDVERHSGKLFCFLRYDGDGRQSNWSGNMSTDGGMTWSETITWWASYVLNISSVVIDSHAYIAFPQGTDRGVAYLIRLRVSDGLRDTFPGGSNYFRMAEVTSPDSIRELRLASNEQTSGSRIYCAYSRNDSALFVVGFSTPEFDTFTFPAGPTDVACGLDFEWNGYPSADPLILSYLQGDNRVRVYGYDIGGSLEPLYTGAQSGASRLTSLGCHQDTLMVVFDQMRSTVMQTKYLVRYGDTTVWYQGGIGDTLLGLSRGSNATGRWGDGFAVVYWQQPQDPWGQTFRSRPYRGAWTDPDAFQDGNTFSLEVPSVERIGEDTYGVVFQYAERGGMAYFDRNVWTAVREPAGGAPGQRRLAVGTIVNGSLRLPGDSPAVLLDITGRKVADLRPGENPVAGLRAGVYFLKHVSDDARAKVIIGH